MMIFLLNIVPCKSYDIPLDFSKFVMLHPQSVLLECYNTKYLKILRRNKTDVYFSIVC